MAKGCEGIVCPTKVSAGDKSVHVRACLSGLLPYLFSWASRSRSWPNENCDVRLPLDVSVYSLFINIGVFIDKAIP